MIRARIAMLAAMLGVAASPAQAGTTGLATADSFRIGDAGVVCTAQARPFDADTRGMFDRSYAIVCQDAAADVGRLHAIRAKNPPALGDLIARRGAALQCSPFGTAPVAGVPGAALAECTRKTDGLPYRIYAVSRRGVLYVAEGLRGYDSAVALGFRALATNRPVQGAVEVAVTQAGDPAAFARVQAGSLDADAARIEGYARNNAGNFAEAAAFFGTLVDAGGQGAAPTENVLNMGLQQSNLGNDAAAGVAFAQAERRGATTDPVLGRLLRNYRAMAALGRHDAATALAALQAPVAAIAPPSDADPALADGEISAGLADALNRSDLGARRLGLSDSRLRPAERAELLDAQGAMLRGAALRLTSRPAEALGAYADAKAKLAAVRGGRITTTGFLSAQLLAETALAEEARGDVAGAGRDLQASVHMLDIAYPRSAAGLMARTRLAAFRARHGDTGAALALYGEVIDASADVPGAAAPLRSQLNPYFDLLAAQAATDPDAVGRMFAAAQVLQRPGLAQTQAVLARELSAGDDEAARLFRDAVNQAREVTRVSGVVAALAETDPKAGTPEAAQLAAAREQLKALSDEQVTMQAKLADYPRYKVLDPQGLSLADLQKTLRAGEAYYELRVLGGDAYAIFVTPDTARAAKLGVRADALADAVAAVRASIVRIDEGRFLTEPFDLVRARQLYVALFGPFGDALKGVKHLIYEPDGPLLQLPANLFVTDQASVDAYRARTASPSANAFDFTGIAWLGRDRDVTTAVSPRAFVDVRRAPASAAKEEYLGLGHNARPNLMASFLAPRPVLSADGCAWPASTWTNPISATELTAASDVLGAGRSKVVTGAGFSDTAIAAMGDIGNYRVVHFATHGLVTAPRPTCPARPALLTSFGGTGSDGLLSFREIYDLRLDADVVILSACDTAGMATIAATREAGVATGGNFALDGLVRAFVGAGARTVVASHWPVPDDYDATKRLVLGMLSAPPGTPIATALRGAEAQLMNDPATSHPYYWAAFAIVGDGERPVDPKR